MFNKDYCLFLSGHLSQNFALGKNSEQSSTNESAAAGRAVDGNRDSNFIRNSCTLTQTESNPWWRVDLKKIVRMNAIILTNRDDGDSTLSGAELWIGESLQFNDGRTIRYTWFQTCRQEIWKTILESHSVLFSPLWHEGVQSSLLFRKDRHHTYHVNLRRDAMSPFWCQVTAKPWVSVKWKCIIWTKVTFFFPFKTSSHKMRQSWPKTPV